VEKGNICIAIIAIYVVMKNAKIKEPMAIGVKCIQ